MLRRVMSADLRELSADLRELSAEFFWSELQSQACKLATEASSLSLHSIFVARTASKQLGPKDLETS